MFQNAVAAYKEVIAQDVHPEGYILKAVEALSRSLGMEVIVEGLETFEELAYLRACTSIRYAQGYYFSRPVMLEELGVTRDDSMREEQVARPRAVNRAYGGRSA